MNYTNTVIPPVSSPGPPVPAADAADIANDIVVVSGPLPVDELNKCLGIAGYCGRMFRRLATMPHGKLHATKPAASAMRH